MAEMPLEPGSTVIVRDPDEDLQSVASLPESESSDSTTDSDDEDDEHDAEREWRESMKQLELMLTLVLIPYLGKYFGRKSAYWIFAKFMRWKYPVDVVMTNPALFKGTGAAIAAIAP